MIGGHRYLFFAIAALIYSSEVVEVKAGSTVPIKIDLSIPLARALGLGASISVEKSGEEDNKIVTVTAKGVDIGVSHDMFIVIVLRHMICDIDHVSYAFSPLYNREQKTVSDSLIVSKMLLIL